MVSSNSVRVSTTYMHGIVEEQAATKDQEETQYAPDQLTLAAWGTCGLGNKIHARSEQMDGGTTLTGPAKTNQGRCLPEVLAFAHRTQTCHRNMGGAWSARVLLRGPGEVSGVFGHCPAWSQ
jgi:hypothetical protein